MVSDRLTIDSTLFHKYRGARRLYPMYPPAGRMGEAFTAAGYRHWLQNRSVGGFTPPLALYLHLPPGVCGCRGVVAHAGEVRTGGEIGRDRSACYVEHLGGEIRLIARDLLADRHCTRMCWSGNTVGSLSERELVQLMNALRSQFTLDPAGDYAVELDRAGVADERIALLAQLGMNRISLGARTSNPATHDRGIGMQDLEATERVIRAARKHGFETVNIDVLYGLPQQTPGALSSVLAQIVACKPDRVSLTSAQSGPLPGASLEPEAALQFLIGSIAQLEAAGYVHAGMEQFARPNDDLAPEQRGRPARALGGYWSDADCDLVALGVSAVSKVGPTYFQNLEDLKGYCAAVDLGVLPVGRGILLSADDLVRRAVIQALTCRFDVSMESISIGHLIDFKQYFAEEMTVLEGLATDGLIELDSEWITVTPRGKWLVSVVCEVFDRYK